MTEPKRLSANDLMYAVNIPSTSPSWYTDAETNIYFNRRMINDLHGAIADGVNPEAAAQYTNMVAGLYVVEQNLRAPRFIDSVFALEKNNWIYGGPHKNGKSYDLSQVIGQAAAIITELQLADIGDDEVRKARDEKAGMLWKHNGELVDPYRTLFREYAEKNFSHMLKYLQ